MPILYNEVVDNVSALVTVVKEAAAPYDVVGVTKKSPLTSNIPDKKPTLLVIFVVGESHDTVINSVFPLCYHAKLPRIVVWLKRGTQTMPSINDVLVISCDAKYNSNTLAYTATPTDAQKEQLKNAVKEWAMNPPSYQVVPEMKVSFFEHWFKTDEALRNKGVKIARQVCSQLAIRGYASRIEDSKESIGIVTWDAGSTRLNEAQLLKTLAANGCLFDQFVLVLINWADFYFPLSDRVIVCVKAKALRDQGWTLDSLDMDQVVMKIESAEEKRKNKSKALPPPDTKQDSVSVEEKQPKPPISENQFRKLVLRTAEAIDEDERIDRVRDWLGAIRWKPLPADTSLSKYEQYACMQALPSEVPAPLLDQLKQMIDRDPRVVELEMTVKNLRKTVTSTDKEPSEELKKMKEAEKQTSEEMRKLKEKITRQEKMINDLQNERVRAKEAIEAKGQIAELETRLANMRKESETSLANMRKESETSLANMRKESETSLARVRTESEQMSSRIIGKVKTKIQLDAKVSLEQAVDQVLDAWSKQDQVNKDLEKMNEQKEATLQAELKVKEQRIAELEANSNQPNPLLVNAEQRIAELEATNRELEAKIRSASEVKEPPMDKAPELNVDQELKEAQALVQNTEEVQKLREDVARKQAIIEKTLGIGNQYKQLQESYQQLLTAMNADDKQKPIADLIIQVQGLKKTLTEKDAKITELQTLCASLKEEISKLKDKDVLAGVLDESGQSSNLRRLEQENVVLKSQVKDLEKRLKEEEERDIQAELKEEQKRWLKDSLQLARLRDSLPLNPPLNIIEQLADPNLDPAKGRLIVDQISKVVPNESKKNQ